MRKKEKKASYPLGNLARRLRRRMGQPEYPAARLEMQQILYPEEDAREALCREDEQRFRRAILCVLAGIVLMLAAALMPGTDTFTVLTRPDYGQSPRQELLDVSLGEEEYQIPLTVESRRYTEEEWERLREEVWKQAEEKALGDNDSWEHITTDLVLTEDSGVPGIDLIWESSNPEVIDYDGMLGKEGLREETPVTLTVYIRSEERVWEQTLTAVVDPRPQNETERKQQMLSDRLREAASDREQAEILLPQESGGQQILYHGEDDLPPVLFLLLAWLAAGALLYLPIQQRQEALKNRERELMIAYPELVSTLTVLMGAGLTVRGAFERMAVSYRRQREAGAPVMTVYEEVLLSVNSLRQGAFEEQVYIEFGRRCALQPYLRLGSLLAANLRKGSGGLLILLREESEAALSARLRQARKKGEEISSRLLLPMLMLFALVLVLLMAPAMMSF